MLVRDVMIRNVRTAKADEPIRSVAAVICTNKISGLPVVDEENNLVGLVSEKDILHALLPSYSDFLDDPVRAVDYEEMEKTYHEVLTKTVKDLMATRVVTVSPNDPLLMAASRMTLHGFRRIPVVDENIKLVGIVSLGDIHKSIFKREFKLE